MSGPLTGVNVLDFGQAGVGPCAASLLGALGASVLKIEHPQGDTLRHHRPMLRGQSIAVTIWNLNKKGATLDLKDRTVRPVLDRLLREADVVMDNLRPGVMTRLGLDFDQVAPINPGIICASSPGWGTSGPLASTPSVDADIQAFSGFASMTGDEGGRAEMARHYYQFDLNAACTLAATTVLGLIQRDRTGRGQPVASTHLGSTLSQLSSRAAEWLMVEQLPVPLGSASATTAPHQAFLCLDKVWVAVGVERDEQWQGLCRALQRDDLAADDRYATNVGRVASRRALAVDLQRTFATRPARWWYVQLTKAGVPVGYFDDYEALRCHAQVLENESIVNMDIPYQGVIAVGGLPFRFSRTPGSLSPAPAPGEHTDEVLRNGFGVFGASQGKQPDHARPNAAEHPPLAGLLVIDASQGLCGPYAALQLADAGAEVIKVEPPGGDYARRFAPRTATGDGASFLVLNRNKQSVVLDLETEADREAFRRLAARADVLIEDWGVGRADALGLGYQALQESNPGLVLCSLSGYGELGPFKDLPISELVAQAMSDYTHSLGQVGEPPVRWGSDMASLGTGGFAFLAILSALYERHRSGLGQRVALSMWGTLVYLRQACWSVMGDVDEWDGNFLRAYSNPRMHGWQTLDRQIYFHLHRASEEAYIELLIELGMEELLADERFGQAGRNAAGSGRYSPELVPIWEEHFGSRPVAEIIAIAESHHAIATPFQTVAEVLDHPQVATLGIVRDVDQPGLGVRRVIGAPFTGAWRAVEPCPAPGLDQHGDRLRPAPR